MHDGVDPADELVHTCNLAQVLLCELKDLIDVQTDEIIPRFAKRKGRERRKERLWIMWWLT